MWGEAPVHPPQIGVGPAEPGWPTGQRRQLGAASTGPAEPCGPSRPSLSPSCPRMGLGREKATTPRHALPAETAHTIHHEPHPPPLLRLGCEIPHPKKQGRPHRRDGQRLPPERLGSQGPGG